jgi:hypothetical protein
VRDGIHPAWAGATLGMVLVSATANPPQRPQNANVYGLLNRSPRSEQVVGDGGLASRAQTSSTNQRPRSTGGGPSHDGPDSEPGSEPLTFCGWQSRFQR